MRCLNCQFENRPGVNFCEQCGEKLPKISIEDSERSQCRSCGFITRAGVRFCEECGHQLDNLIEIPAEEEQPQSHLQREKSKFRKIALWTVIVLLLFLLGLIMLGMIPSKNELAPMLSAEPIPLLTLNGIPASGEAMAVVSGGFSASATDAEGIQRMELYVDGQLTAAQNYPGSANALVVFEPPLEALPEGEHEIMVVTTNTQGHTAHSQVVPITNIDPEPLPPEQGLVIEPGSFNLPSPKVITAILSEDGKMVIVGWSLPEVPYKETRIYLQPPGATGVTLQGTSGYPETVYEFPATPNGLWHIYVSYVSLDEREGPMRHVHMVVPDAEDESEAVSANSKINAASVSLDLHTENLQNGLFAYVRVGGDANRYQRLPSEQGQVLYRQVTGKLFNFKVPLNGWPISQPLLVELELWALNSDQTPWLIGRYSHFFTTAEMADGHIDFDANEFTASIDLELEQKFGYISTVTVGGPRPVLLPTPTHIQIAAFTNQCQFVSSVLGPVYDASYPICIDAVNNQIHQYLLWDWPSKPPDGLHATEDDITGFELKLILTDEQEQRLGENVLAIPFPQARGALRNTQPVACGVRMSWYLRAVSPEAVSDWTYAGTLPPQACGVPEPGVNGCGGQMDFLPDWNPFGDFVPDLIFEPACNTHDKCYNRAWSGKNKVTCDNEFLADMIAICMDYVPLIEPVTCSGVATTYYEAVNLFGRFFYEGDMDVQDCLKAVNQADCLLGHSPEFAANAWNALKSGAKWTGQAFKTGAGKIVDGAQWVGDQVSDGFNKSKDWLSGKNNPLW